MLTAKQEKAARALGRGHTQEGAARIAGCSERSIRNWTRDLPAFTLLIEQTREESGDPDARTVLYELLRSDNETVRLQAARALLMQPPPEDEGGIIHQLVPPPGRTVLPVPE
jgi:HEAT repeat protein